MLRKPQLRTATRFLRKQGQSITEISKTLRVSSSTVSLWVRDINLTNKQKKLLRLRVYTALQRGRIKAQQVQKYAREQKKQELIAHAAQELDLLMARDHFIGGIALYWAEGFKKDNRLGFANSDPAMIKFFLQWLEVLGVPKGDIRLRVGLNISHASRVAKVQIYWEEQTGIPSAQFQKPFFQKFTWKKEFPNPDLYYGVLRIRANNQGALFMKINHWVAAFRSST